MAGVCDNSGNCFHPFSTKNQRPTCGSMPCESEKCVSFPALTPLPILMISTYEWSRYSLKNRLFPNPRTIFNQVFPTYMSGTFYPVTFAQWQKLKFPFGNYCLTKWKQGDKSKKLRDSLLRKYFEHLNVKGKTHLCEKNTVAEWALFLGVLVDFFLLSSFFSQKQKLIFRNFLEMYYLRNREHIFHWPTTLYRILVHCNW